MSWMNHGFCDLTFEGIMPIFSVQLPEVRKTGNKLLWGRVTALIIILSFVPVAFSWSLDHSPSSYSTLRTGPKRTWKLFSRKIAASGWGRDDFCGTRSSSLPLFLCCGCLPVLIVERLGAFSVAIHSFTTYTPLPIRIATLLYCMTCCAFR